MRGISAIYFLESNGKLIISRDYKSDPPINVPERFTEHVLEREDNIMKPVFVVEGVAYCWIKHQDIYIVGVTVHDTNVMTLMTFLYRLGDVLTYYFKSLQDESIRDNFSITYELLDEMVDDGYPQTTEQSVLKEYIKNEPFELPILEPVQAHPPRCITTAVFWRPEGIKHRKNEIFLDVIERLDLLVAANGAVIRSEILGSLKMKSYLSGMPELKLGLNDKLQLQLNNLATKEFGVPVTRPHSIKSILLEDVKFHQCVRLARFESDRTISFIPPDGEFELMSYRLGTQVKPLIWVECTLSEPKASSSLYYVVKVKSNYRPRNTANDVAINIPVPEFVDSPSFKAPIGSVKYVPDKNIIAWSIKQLQGQKEYTMSANIGLPSVSDEKETKMSLKRPITVSFEIPYFSISNMVIRYLKIFEKSGYQALPWVRYITCNGDYQLRIS